MLKRTLTGILLLGSLLGVIALNYCVSPIFLDLYILAWTSVAVYELCKSFEKSGRHIHKLPLVFMLLTVYPVFYCLQHFFGMGAEALLIVFLTSVALEIGIFTFGNKEKNTLADMSSTLFILVYPTLIMSCAFLIAFKYSSTFSILFIAMLAIFTDIAAYIFGRTIGGKKLCPSISPKKTIAGAVGGLLGGMILATAFFLFFDVYNVLPKSGYIPFIAHTVEGWEWKSALIYLAIGFIGAVVAEIGDLVASRIKRELDIKDYGKIFPGHGGVMDRMDSMLTSIIVLLIAFTAIYGF